MKRQIILLLSMLFFYLNVAAQPPNDDCVNAVQLTPSANMTCTGTAGSNVGVISTNYDVCAEFSKRNVWYKFTATSGNHIVQVTFGTMQNGSINGFRNGCGTLTHLNCGGLGSAGPVIQQVFNGLIPGEEYLIAVSTREETDEGTFEICILTPPAPVNDDCGSAINLTVNASNAPVIRTTGNTQFATQSMPACTGTADDDVWFSFVATQPLHRVFIFNTGNSLSLEAFSGSCGALVSIACSTPSGSVKSLSLSALVPGQTYFIRVYSFDNLFNGQQSFQIALTSAPENDNCSNPLVVTPSANGSNTCASPVAGSSFDATQSGADCFGGNQTSNDTWFSFTATQEVHKVKVFGFGGNSIRFEVMAGTCSGLTSLFCNTPSFSGDTAMTTLGSLVSGNTYHIRVYSNGLAGLFNVCVTSPEFPANNDCANAFALNVSSDSTLNYITGSTVNATSTAITGTCNDPGLDVWYSFVATSPRHIIKAVNTTNISTLFIELFSGSCGSLVHQRCSNNSSDSLFGLGNLTIGETYRIRIYNGSQFFGDEFKIAVFTPQALINDDCSNAINIIPTSNASCVEISGTNTGATQSVNDNCDGNTLIGNIKDVWYKFTATSASHRIRLIKGTGNRMRFKLYTASCNSLTTIACSAQNTSNLIGSAIEQRFDALTIGNTYFVRVFNTASEVEGTFDLCIKTVVVPVNNECAAATSLTVQDDITFGTYITGNTTDATASAQPTQCSTGQDDDVWYQFTATQAIMKISLQNGSIGATRMVLYSGTCAGLTLIRCQTGNVRDNVMLTGGLVAGNVYFVRIYSSATSGSQGTFSIMVTTDITIPANDECINAVSLVPSADNICTNTQGTTVDATFSGNSTCVAGFEVWYKFIAGASSHRVNVEGLINTPFITVFSGSCAGLTQLPSACSGGALQVSVTVSSLVIGNTYFVKVLASTTADFQQSSFNICITTPQVPVNDLCGNAIMLPVENDASGESLQQYSTNLATFTGVPNCFAIGNDVWFSFIAPQSAVNIEVNALNTQPGLELLSGSCGALVSLICNGTHSTNLKNVLNADNLVTGNTYYVRVSSATFSTPLEFKIKIYKAQSQKINSSIDTTCLLNNIAQNPGLESDFFVQTSFVSAANPGAQLINKWRIPTRGTADFFNAINTPGSAVEIPFNQCFGIQSARNGFGYGGIFTYSSGGGSYREYLENEFSEPMVPGKRYLVSMYVSLADYSTIAIDNIGIALRTTQTQELTFSNLSFTPQIVTPDNVFIDNKNQWVNISGVITADQPYQYMVIGNFKTNALTDTIRVADTSQLLSGGTFSGCASTTHSAYYYIDDVMVSEINPAVSGCGGLVPLTLLNFTGQKVNKTVELKWTTENEINTSNFEVHRSNNGVDYSVIGSVTARNTSGVNQYSFTDERPFTDINYYRLRQVDMDGRFTMSNIVRIKWDLSKDQMQVFPNPVKDILTISGLMPHGMITLFNSQGELLHQEKVTANTISFQMNKYAKGVYLLRYVNGGVRSTMRVIVD